MNRNVGSSKLNCKLKIYLWSYPISFLETLNSPPPPFVHSFDDGRGLLYYHHRFEVNEWRHDMLI